MLISWEWLADYVTLDAPIDQVVDRWALSGLNHESTEWVEGVPVIDLEVTSNRADCLGHIGIAREAAVLYSLALKNSTDQQCRRCDQLCDDGVRAAFACFRFESHCLESGHRPSCGS
ncbi:MAG: hypothetical protein NT168_01675 [Planctomycetota bacterium]|nr:hypothetical protein [Planctomycetota bacterium]